MMHLGFLLIFLEGPTPALGRVRFRTPADSVLMRVLSVSFTLAGPAPWQSPQSARREDGGEEPEHANRDQRPDEEEVSAGIGEPAGDADALSLHVDVGHDQ